MSLNVIDFWNRFMATVNDGNDRVEHRIGDLRSIAIGAPASIAARFVVILGEEIKQGYSNLEWMSFFVDNKAQFNQLAQQEIDKLILTEQDRKMAAQTSRLINLFAENTFPGNHPDEVKKAMDWLQEMVNRK